MEDLFQSLLVSMDLGGLRPGLDFSLARISP